MTVNVCLGLHLERPLSILVCLQLAGISENFHKQLANPLPLTCIIQILPTINHKTKKIQGLLTSCANILYSSSLVTEILSLSVLSTTTITNFKKLKVSQRTNSFWPHTCQPNRLLFPSHYLDSQLDYQIPPYSRHTSPSQSVITRSTGTIYSLCCGLYTKVALTHILTFHFPFSSEKFILKASVSL